MQTLLFLWIALINNVKFFPLILWLSMPIDEGAQPFWEGEASLGISEIGAFLHFHAFRSRKCALHNEFQRAAISYLRNPEMEAHRANRHANGMSGWWGTSGQVGSSHLMKSWDTITTGRDYCLVPSALFRQWDFGRKFLDITLTPLLQNPFLIFIIHWPQLHMPAHI